jgi:hypothetical protein
VLNFLTRLWSGTSKDPLAYQLPLAWFDLQLPTDLLATNLHWVWESWRAGKVASPKVPEHRTPVVLTKALAPNVSAELGEYDGEIGRAFLAFATASPIQMTPTELTAAIRAFAKDGTGPLLAIIWQEPLGPATFFVSRTPPAALQALLQTWAGRIGKPLDSIAKRADSARMLKHVFLDAKTARPLQGLP